VRCSTGEDVKRGETESIPTVSSISMHVKNVIYDVDKMKEVTHGIF